MKARYCITISNRRTVTKRRSSLYQAARLAFFGVDISERLPRKTFKLAQYVREDRADLEGTIHRAIKIWEVASVLEGYAVIGLCVTCLKTIPVDPDVVDWQLSLSLKTSILSSQYRPMIQCSVFA
ncbi:hypothetical protein CPC08DRAFT_528069 [Agrocybe pediades]|nr:hypothetical protein CPC08DRAFT_528069 [Agrocybe pediades]